MGAKKSLQFQRRQVLSRSSNLRYEFICFFGQPFPSLQLQDTARSARSSSDWLGIARSSWAPLTRSSSETCEVFFRALEALVAAGRALKALVALISRWESSQSSNSHSEWLGVAWRSSGWLGVARSSWSPPTWSSSECSSELLGSELQALLSPYKSAACWRESPLLRSFEVKNSELWLQMGPASAVCGGAGSTLPRERNGSSGSRLKE